MESLSQILSNYFININNLIASQIPKSEEGLFNKTFIVQDSGIYYILQKVNSILKENVFYNIEHITERMSKLGWEMPNIIRTRSGTLYHQTKDGTIWRLYNYILGENIKDINKIDLYMMGSLLSKFHSDLYKINFIPKSPISNFHNFSYYLKKIERLKKFILDKKLYSIAEDILTIKEIEIISTKNVQLIHGDCRFQNIIYDKNGIPFTFIDLDTFMNGSIFIDIGDLLRSISCDEEQIRPSISVDNIKKVINGYYNCMKEKMGKVDFVKSTLAGFKQITLELCMRFVIDYVEDYYFAWDKEKYSSRKENNRLIAIGQWDLYNQINSISEKYLLDMFLKEA
ncbi:phosphotransferase enzyme family protein [Virgibacillus sp. Bac330]|uniref:phosphotransferase enzyme family protein n=1 Tax=Virgibacillus sp. Bac330 TaxID=2419841 RepID=UPI000EF51978|nr:aminoglycoside phosphotransferase family protein [Virgibacillus sp. Bac330]